MDIEREAKELVEAYVMEDMVFKEMRDGEILDHQWVMLPTSPKKYAVNFPEMQNRILALCARVRDEALEEIACMLDKKILPIHEDCDCVIVDGHTYEGCSCYQKDRNEYAELWAKECRALKAPGRTEGA